MTTIRQIPIAPDETAVTGDIETATALRNAVYAIPSGTDEEDTTPAAFLQEFTGTTQLHRLWLCELGGRPVGLARMHAPVEAGATSVYTEILLLPEFESQGIGTLALRVIEDEARSMGRLTLIGEAEHLPDPTLPRLTPPTGFGSIPEDHIARFLAGRGWSFEQVERKSSFDLTADLAPVREHQARAATAAEGYEVLAWDDATPAEFREPMARLHERMSTDIPTAALELVPEKWSSERIIQKDERRAASGERTQTTVARHIASGELVAFNVLSREASDPASTTFQGDTLVHGDHRGHRLGMLVKTAGILRWREQNPHSTRILTWNAEENRPMLSINEELGFVPAGYIGAWQKRLTP
ncbi:MULTISPECIES: GNAT family N-acetyltransferase [Microbacterium]|uniref:GNAT family N-acetyltransferase n=1 Tax=Microbacterium TaxID=33882 RepID=UPI001E37786F|nr:GNAT family N-acetyltransferase [Microbacterium nymphoidis]MCD2497127.1 GNAT family N-acetyltransferase [Microbacterium nymphoidis]